VQRCALPIFKDGPRAFHAFTEGTQKEHGKHGRHTKGTRKAQKTQKTHGRYQIHTEGTRKTHKRNTESTEGTQKEHGKHGRHIEHTREVPNSHGRHTEGTKVTKQLDPSNNNFPAKHSSSSTYYLKLKCLTILIHVKVAAILHVLVHRFPRRSSTSVLTNHLSIQSLTMTFQVNITLLNCRKEWIISETLPTILASCHCLMPPLPKRVDTVT
jgi:hypothetical protein